MERNLRQFKQAVKLFEQAASDSIINENEKIWIEYGKFCRSRGKFSNAHKVYRKALEILPMEEAKEKIWIEFFHSIQEKEKGKGGQSIISSVEELKSAIMGSDDNSTSTYLGRKRMRGESSESTSTNSSRENSLERSVASLKTTVSNSDDLRPKKILHTSAPPPSQSVPVSVPSPMATSSIPSLFSRPSIYNSSTNTVTSNQDLSTINLEEIIAQRPPELFDSGIPRKILRENVVTEIAPSGPFPFILPTSSTASPSSLPDEQKYSSHMNLGTYYPLGESYDVESDPNTVNGVELTPEVLEGLKYVLANDIIFDILKSLHATTVMTHDAQEKLYYKLEVDRQESIKSFLHKYNIPMKDESYRNELEIPIQYRSEFQQLNKSYDNFKLKPYYVALNQELLQLLYGQQQILNEMGVPYFTSSNDPVTVDFQKKILSTLFANFYLYRLNFKNP